MLHIMTVHWEDERWVDIQLKYFQENIKTPYKVYAFLNKLPNDHSHKFFYSSTEAIASHPIKLNLLADMATLHADSEEDMLLFIDGDAFPIGDVVSYASEHLDTHPLIAIQRLENDGDIQPHPCFCMTTVKFWNEIKGDWKAGYKWKNAYGSMVTDVGGNLLGLVEEKKVDWLPMLRSNKREMHKLWFGIYADLVYHHGAGFRDPVSRIDMRNDSLLPALEFKNKYLKRLYEAAFRRQFKLVEGKTIQKNTSLSEEVFQNILNDKDFYRYFQSVEKEQTA